MTGMIADPRVLAVLEAVARGEDVTALSLRAGMTAAEVAATLARLGTFGIVRRQRRGSRVQWCLAGNVAAWLAQGYEIAASLRRD